MVPKGYWINYVEEIIDQEAFDRYVTKVNALIERGADEIISVKRTSCVVSG